MPLFDLKNAKRKLSSPSLSSLVLRKTQSTGNIEDSTERIIINNDHSRKNSTNVIIKPIIVASSTDTISILKRSPTSSDQQQEKERRPPTPPSTVLNSVIEEDNADDELLASKLRDITACDMELLLSLETQARMDCQEEKEKKQQEQMTAVIRPSRIKFDLPITPPRSKSPDHSPSNNAASTAAARQRRWSMPEDINNKKKPSNRLSRWSKLIKQQQQEEAQHNSNKLHKTNSASDTDSHNSSEDDSLLFDNNGIQDIVPQQQRITIGSKVKLFKRPLPIIGTVKYLGKVHFDTGEWLGIELDSRVGNTDGKIDGQRYFQTNLHCGIFVKKEDAIKV